MTAYDGVTAAIHEMSTMIAVIHLSTPSIKVRNRFLEAG